MKSKKLSEILKQWEDDYNCLDIEDTEQCEVYFSGLKNTYFLCGEELRRSENLTTRKVEELAHEQTEMFGTMLRILARYIYEAKYVPETVSLMMATHVMKRLNKHSDIFHSIDDQIEMFAEYFTSVQYDSEEDIMRFITHHPYETDAIHEYVNELYDGHPEKKQFDVDSDYPSDGNKMA